MKSNNYNIMSNIVTYNDWFNVAPCVVDKTINPSGESIIDKNISPIPETNDVDESYFQVAMKVSQKQYAAPVIDKVTGVQDCRDIVDSVQVYKAWEDAYPTNMTPVDNEEELYRDNIGEALEEKPIESVIEKVEVKQVEETEESVVIESDVVVEPAISEIEVKAEDVKVEEPVVKEKVTKKKVTDKKPVKRTTKKKTEVIQEPKDISTIKPRKSTRKTAKAKENK